MANYPLAALMGTFANIANVFGNRYAKQQDLKDRLSLSNEMEAKNRPAAEAMKRRQMLMSMGIDPDTGNPIPEFWAAKEQAAKLAQRYRKDGGESGGEGGGKKRRKGKSAAERQREADAAQAAKGDDGDNWFTSLFK